MRIARKMFVPLGLLGALLVPAAAFANVSASVDDGGNAGGAVASGGSGSLPFTGLNLALILIVGVALLATGVLLRRRSGTNPS